MQLDKQEIQKLVRGERAGTVATIFCGVVLVAFGAALIYFAASGTGAGSPAKIAVMVTCPLLIAAGAGSAAFFNLKFGGAIDRLLKNYIRDVMIENAALMHPERNSLTFSVSIEGTSAAIKVNGYTENIIFDFSAFGKLSAMRKAAVASEIEKRITVTFLKLLLERGLSFKSVDIVTRAGSNKSKPVPVIADGKPDKRSMKIYRKEG